ncbi:DUF2892 domain-containing protein [Yoonia sp.]|uniref:YgaP family membrane protein n=1 Tax=Yoonia sp. TaxID=2212373 RepID=UPI0025D2D2A7|nr:DUF2892 domain-containing protein [Yoonia sp.]
MATNVGTVDRFIRFVVGIALFIAPLLNFMGTGSSAVVAYVLMGIGAILVLTSVMRVCPIYRVLGLSTFKA